MGMRRNLGIALAIALPGLIYAGISIKRLFWVPEDEEPVDVWCGGLAPELPRGEPIKVLVWNVQYMGSRKHHFFYDGGEAVHVPEGDVRETIGKVAEVVREHDPDIILWQELDRGSDRTHGIDEHQELLSRLTYPCHASAPYHRVGYVPTPSQQHLGRVDMELSVFSRYRIDTAMRHQLALLDEPWWRRLFNLRRAVLEVTLPVEGGGTLHALNTHLSAFSKNDGTLETQIGQLEARVGVLENEGKPWVLAGDLNALPPGDDRDRLGDEGRLYYAEESPVLQLFQRRNSVIPAPQYEAEPERWRTYIPFGATEPDRTLDYAFTGREVEVGEVAVLPVTELSDHLPLLFTITVP